MRSNLRKSRKVWNLGVSRHSILLTIMTTIWVAKVVALKTLASRSYLAKCWKLYSRMQAPLIRRLQTWFQRRTKTTRFSTETQTTSVSPAWIMNQLITRSEVHLRKEKTVLMVVKTLKSRKKIYAGECTILLTSCMLQVYYLKGRTSKFFSILTAWSVKTDLVKILRMNEILDLNHRPSMQIEAGQISSRPVRTGLTRWWQIWKRKRGILMGVLTQSTGNLSN